MNALELLNKYFTDPEAREIVTVHSRLVADKALKIADRIGNAGIDRVFLEEAALLHDIGTCRTHAPSIRCQGSENYMRHGVIGREILEAEGLPRHALVCERHTGVGLTVEDIRSQSLPLPERDMSPLTIEEQIICFADLFYSKKGRDHVEKSVREVREQLSRFGEEKVRIFEEWLERFDSVS
jgi:uncharacterized protein